MTENTIPESEAPAQSEIVNTAASAKTPFEVQFARKNPKLVLEEVRAALALFASGVPVPTIITQHKEQVPTLSVSAIYTAIDEKEIFDQIEKHQAHLIREIEARGGLTPELKEKINSTLNLNALDDIYLPFKLKGRTVATIAKEAGLEPLANWIWDQGHSETPDAIALEEKAKEFVKEGSDFGTVEAVMTGAQNILTERIAETAELRNLVRQSIFRKSKVRSVKGPKAKERSKFQRFFDYREPIGSIKKASGAQRYLTIRKGAAANELIVSFDRADEGIINEKFEVFACPHAENPHKALLHKVARTALNSQVYTAIEHEAHKMLKDIAEKSLLTYLTDGLQKRLLVAPFGSKVVIGIDPGLENKPCTIALLDGKGALLTDFSFPINSEADWEKFRTDFVQSLEKVNVEAIAIAHGPKGKQVRKEIVSVLEKQSAQIPTTMVYEQSTTIYSTSSVAKEELPDLDPAVRRAIFVGRFLQDPLREMVKVDPKFLATGAFQFDINPARLGKALHRTIQAAVCVARININECSRSLLAYIPGLDHNLAKAILRLRDSKSGLSSIDELNAISELSAEKLAQASPFLNFEATPVENRGNFAFYQYQSEFADLATVEINKQVAGVITNITNFGVFIDIGLDQDGLVHISEFTDSTELFGSLAIGEPVTVWISAVEKTKSQLSLSFRSPEERQKRVKARRPGGSTARSRGNRNANNANPNRRRPVNRGASKDGEQDAAPANGERQENREGRSAKGPNERGARGKRPDRKDRDNKPAKKRPPQRDPKTGAIMKLDDSVYVSERPARGAKGKQAPRSKFKTKADVVTFNPFANLDKLVKTSNTGNGKESQDS